MQARNLLIIRIFFAYFLERSVYLNNKTIENSSTFWLINTHSIILNDAYVVSFSVILLCYQFHILFWWKHDLMLFTLTWPSFLCIYKVPFPRLCKHTTYPLMTLWPTFSVFSAIPTSTICCLRWVDKTLEWLVRKKHWYILKYILYMFIYIYTLVA